ncbi:hypothetical protein M885DRAFT_454129 [Pelagophyceae sp. CCMP2097]|nr:hypothetical protein M885DRAFT_454129 [Pelagophyceae sp. CCMP2097]
MYAELCLPAGAGDGAAGGDDAPDDAPDGDDAAGGACYGTNFWCAVCEVRVRRQSFISHQTALAHTFCRRLKPFMRRVMLPDGNRGSLLLRKLGWHDDGERSGLGPEGREGRVLPVRTTLKRDRSGLGAKDYERRVTHFKPLEAAAVLPPRADAAQRRPPTAQAPRSKAARRRDAKQAADKHTAADRRNRRDFGGSIPEGFEAFFR